MANQDKYSRRVKASRADEREALTGMRQSIGGMIAKIAFGIMFIGVGFDKPESGWSIGYFAVALCCGGALIAWGLVPFLAARKKRKAAEEEKAAEQAAKILAVPLEKFGDGGVDNRQVKDLERKYEEKAAGTGDRDLKPISGVDWNKDGKLDWQDAAVDRDVLREHLAKQVKESLPKEEQ